MKMTYVFAILFTMFLAQLAMADCSTQVSEETAVEQLEIKTDVPKYLEGATITVKLSDGRESTVPAEKFKVVPRKQQFITTKTIAAHVKTCTSPERNRVSVLGGSGPKGTLSRTDRAGQTDVESNNGAVLGLQYQYRTDLKLFGLPLSFGAQAQDNKTALGLLGVEF